MVTADAICVFDRIHDLSWHRLLLSFDELKLGDPAFGLRTKSLLTNGLISNAVLVPSVVAFLVELQRSGFTYSKGG